MDFNTLVAFRGCAYENKRSHNNAKQVLSNINNLLGFHDMEIHAEDYITEYLTIYKHFRKTSLGNAKCNCATLSGILKRAMMAGLISHEDLNFFKNYKKTISDNGKIKISVKVRDASRSP